jgi:hypothetical protein
MFDDNNLTSNCSECNQVANCPECNPQELPALEACSEGNKCIDVYYTGCGAYDGPNITCGAQTLVPTGTNLNTVLQSLYAQICAGGFVGVQGPAGPVGPMPTITVQQTVEIATPSLPPIVTSTEIAPGEYELAFRLPKGADGISPNVVPFNVATLTPGSPVTVTLDPSSTQSLKRFNFGIPKGDKGDQGDQGISIVSGTVNGSGNLILSLSDNTTYDAGYVVGPAGDPGDDGEKGTPGSNSLVYYIGTDAAGNIALNTSISSGVTTITASKTSKLGYTGVNQSANNADSWLSDIEPGDIIQIYNTNDASTFGIYRITATGLNGGGTSYVFTVLPIATNGSFPAGEVAVSFTLKGDKGDPGVDGQDGDKGAVGPNSLVYKVEPSTTPASGNIVTNNFNLALVNTLQVNKTSLLGYTGSTATVNNAVDWLNGLLNNTRFQLVNVNDSSIFGIYKIQNITDSGTYFTLSVLTVVSNGVITTGDQYAASYAVPGIDGNYLVTSYITPGGGTCPLGGVLIETRSGEDDSVLDTKEICVSKDGNYASTEIEPAGSNCPCGGLKLNVHDGETNAIIDFHYVCDKCEYGAMLAQNTGAPDDILSHPWTHGNSVICQSIGLVEQVMKPSVGYDDDNAYNPATGVWTCPVTGRYNLDFFVHLTIESTTHPDGWYTGAPGLFIAGITSYTNCSMYTISQVQVLGPLKHLQLTGSALGMNIAQGTELCLRVVNMTGRDYTTNIVGDVTRMTIQRVK